MAATRMKRRRPRRKSAPLSRRAERERQERKLDDALRDSFPASDPVSFLEPCPSDEKGAGD
ncbi:MAG: hypothetical protein KF889_18135 [Alphaproteobacteria bacterium]|nr:hypothetical protein [Alphaproteobacteria bacterium]MCW5744013.1 hypothetical protein [Alphaproteobacteria bacterium]